MEDWLEVAVQFWYGRVHFRWGSSRTEPFFRRCERSRAHSHNLHARSLTRLKYAGFRDDAITERAKSPNCTSTYTYLRAIYPQSLLMY